jgi:multiple sugar transport system permease protein
MLVLVGTFVLVPALVALIRSLYDWSPGARETFIGLDNFRELFASTTFHEIALNQLIFVIGAPLWAGVPLLVAVLLYERVPAAGLFRAIFFLPALMSPATIGILFRALLRPDGSLNGILESVGLGSLALGWIDHPLLVKPVIIVVVLWFTMGFGVVLYAAALSTLDPQLLEAAELDGASWAQRTFHVLLPRIIPIFALQVVFSTATAFQLFPYAYLLTSGGPGYASTSLDYDIYQNALGSGYFGLAAAESVLLLAAMSVILLAASWVSRRKWVQ